MKLIIAALSLLTVSTYCTAQDNSYQDPADGKSYVAPHGWKSYTPKHGVPSSHEKVRIAGVRLLQSQDEIASRSDPAGLASFIQLTHQAASEAFVSYDKPAVVLTQFSCVPDKCTPQIASQGNPPNNLLLSYYDKLMKLTPPRVSGEIKFEVTLSVNS